MNQFLKILTDRILSGGAITFDEAVQLLNLEGREILSLADASNRIREHYCGRRIDLCSIINAKSGRCPEDCRFCAQSSHYSTGCTEYPLLKVDRLIEAAKQAKEIGATNFCIVTSGRQLDEDEFHSVCLAIEEIQRKVDIAVDGSLGFLSMDRASRLKEAGISRYNHNLETSKDYYPNICSTHKFNNRVQTVIALKVAGISTCCGGIVGLGEESHQRIELAFALKDLDVDCVPINILNPRPGTPLFSDALKRIEPMEVIQTIAIFRMILPKVIIKVAGGRQVGLRSLESLALLSGANGFIIGNYLTTQGGDPDKDLQMIKDLGYEFRS